MSFYFYMILLQVLIPVHIFVLTCVNVPIKLGPMTTQIQMLLCWLLLYLSFFYLCLYKLSIAQSCIYTVIIIVIMLKSIQSCTTHVHAEISHARVYHVYKNLYNHCKCCKLILYNHMPYKYYLYHNYCFTLYMYIVHFSSCGIILSLIAYHLPS